MIEYMLRFKHTVDELPSALMADVAQAHSRTVAFATRDGQVLVGELLFEHDRPRCWQGVAHAGYDTEDRFSLDDVTAWAPLDQESLRDLIRDPTRGTILLDS
jgi:hypothetical protein